MDARNKTLPIRHLLALTAMAILTFSCANKSTNLSGGTTNAKAPRTKKETPAVETSSSKPVVTPEPIPVQEKPEPVTTPEPVVEEEGITKGSFTVLTDPKDPEEGEDYFVIIKVALPKDIKEYSWTDLRGNLVGTDQYTQQIAYKTPPDYFDLQGNTAIIKVLVPGAELLVKDTIKIRSTLLNESQEIAIVF